MQRLTLKEAFAEARKSNPANDSILANIAVKLYVASRKQNAKPGDLTDLERQLLTKIINSEFQSDKSNPFDDVWVSELNLTKELVGALTSCIKKGYVIRQHSGKEAIVCITKKGFSARQAI